MEYIGYIRVSTRSQGQSGLGLKAQSDAIDKFVGDGTLIYTYKEIESGKNDSRPILKEAIAHTKRIGGKLLIAKLDRLSRNASFIFQLRDSGVDFIACDMPDANKLTVGIMAVLAQDERERISQRTKDALAELKKNGVKLGSPQNLTDRSRELAKISIQKKARDNENNKRARAYARSLRTQGLSFQKIADDLNENGYKTAKGFEFKATQVWRLVN